MSKEVDQRLKAIETRLSKLETPRVKSKKPWLLHAGWAKDDPVYEKAMKLGAAWRKSS